MAKISKTELVHLMQEVNERVNAGFFDYVSRGQTGEEPEALFPAIADELIARGIVNSCD